MKRLLPLAVSFLLFAGTARADAIGIYSDATGFSCDIALGFNPNITIIHKFSIGTTGSRFKVEFPVGTQFFAFTSPYPAIGTLTSDITVGYGECMTGSIVVGTALGIVVAGAMQVMAADGQVSVLYFDCVFAEKAAVGLSNCGPNETEASSWGKVKALYR